MVKIFDKPRQELQPEIFIEFVRKIQTGELGESEKNNFSQLEAVSVNFLHAVFNKLMEAKTKQDLHSMLSQISEIIMDIETEGTTPEQAETMKKYQDEFDEWTGRVLELQVHPVNIDRDLYPEFKQPDFPESIPTKSPIFQSKLLHALLWFPLSTYISNLKGL